MSVRFEVEVGVVRALESRDLFRFAEDVGNAVEEVIAPAERYATGVDPTYFTRLREHVHLAAAEYALVPLLVNAPMEVERPVPVAARLARLATLKFDCSLLRDCPELHPQAMGPDELTIFASDARRVNELLGDFSRLAEGPNVLHEVVFALERIHTEHKSPVVRAVTENAVLRLQGLLWRLHLTVAGYPGYPGPLEAALDDSRDVLQLP